MNALELNRFFVGAARKAKAFEALQFSADAYREAFESKCLACPLSNCLPLQALYLLPTANKKERAFEALVKTALPLIRTQIEKFKSAQAEIFDFRGRYFLPNLLLTKLLLGIKGAQIKAVTNTYLELWE